MSNVMPGCNIFVSPNMHEMSHNRISPVVTPEKKKHMQKITWDKMSHKIREMSPNAA
jgi:hypothetical protein